MKEVRQESVYLFEGDYYSAVRDKLPEAVAEKMRRFSFFDVRKDRFLGLRFVGRFTAEHDGVRYDVCCFPKYMKETEDIEGCIGQMPAVLKAIDKTGRLYDYIGSAEFDENNYNRHAKNIGIHGVAKWLINDYASNGIFSVKQKTRVSSGQGRTDWLKTVSLKTPVFDGEEPVYGTPVKTRFRANDMLLISHIHRCAVNEAYEFLKTYGSRSDLLLPAYRKELSGKLESLSGVVKAFQRTAFSARDISLLRHLDAWCTKCSKYYRLPVGTVSFEGVWEDCARLYFGNIPKGFSFGNPEYVIGGRTYTLNNDSIPDIINIYMDGGTPKFILLDAKYYLGSTDGGRITEVPGYKDIAKQVDYYATLRNEYGLEQGVNAFIMPRHDIGDGSGAGDGNAYMRYMGYASKGRRDSNDEVARLLKSLTCGKYSPPKNDGSYGRAVDIIQVNPDRLFDSVLNGESVDAAGFCAWLSEQRANTAT